MPRIRVNDVELFHELHGHGNSLACICGLGVHSGYWAPIVQKLAARHRLLIYDHRGSGRSDAPPGAYSIGQMAEDFIRLLDALEVERTDVLGHSMGGYVALHAAAHHPDRVRKLVLYSTTAVMNWPAARFLESIDRVWSECPSISTGALTRIFAPWNWSPQLLMDDSFVDTVVQMAELNPYKMTLEAFRAQVSACRGFDAEPLLARIGAATLVIGGEHDLIAPPATQRHLADRLSKARLVFSEAGHNTHLEVPPWFVEQVTGFTDDSSDQ